MYSLLHLGGENCTNLKTMDYAITTTLTIVQRILLNSNTNGCLLRMRETQTHTHTHTQSLAINQNLGNRNKGTNK